LDQAEKQKDHLFISQFQKFLGYSLLANIHHFWSQSHF